jgi:hypothetical protein
MDVFEVKIWGGIIDCPQRQIMGRLRPLMAIYEGLGKGVMKTEK